MTDAGPANQRLSAALGATVSPAGVHFAVYSGDATGIELVFFERADDAGPSRVITLDRVANRDDHWETFVPGVRPGQLYGYRAHGPFQPSGGLRFDPHKLLLDPYGRGVVVPSGYDRDRARRPGDNAAAAMKNVVVDLSAYDWEGDVPLRRPPSQTLVYEMHVRGFTQHPSAGVSVEKRGTYAGVMEKIPYLQTLGVTAVELLPIFQFDRQDAPAGLVNYWGYAPVSMFSPHRGYSSRPDLLGPMDEFRDLVKALHRAGVEVILDVVYNHTAENGADGPTISFRGLDNRTYYILAEDRSQYADFTGTGNTLNVNHPIVRRMILDSLRYWVAEMHVDGFRFDLASILTRDSSGKEMPNPPILSEIESDPLLAGAKMFAEPWDAAGLYQVGRFAGRSWREWNGRFRDDVRAFFRGEDNTVKQFADRLIGSPDIYGPENREAELSLNFVTCHDGFTLNDLVSYNEKHNEANGQENRDGADDNHSWNFGVEGPTGDPAIESARNRQVKNFFTVTLLSLGVPMILMGDEVRRTQRGNNNAYCQDGEVSWFDWTLLDRHADVHRFVELLCRRRVLRNVDPGRRPVPLNELVREAIVWHGVTAGEPDWGPQSHSLAVSAAIDEPGVTLYLAANAYWEPLDFELPAAVSTTAPTGVSWRRWIDTARESPDDIVEWSAAPTIGDRRYRVEPQSVIVLMTP